MLPSDHNNHWKWQDSMYRGINKGVKESQIFTAHHTTPGRLMKQDHKEASCRYDEVLPTKCNDKAKLYSKEERKEQLQPEWVLHDFQSLQPTSLRPIKQ
eukprot:7008578-Ditylum_brightwellii.AAC.1